MNEHELERLLGGARRAAARTGLPADFACQVQALLPPRVLSLCTRGLLVTLAVLSPLAVVAAVMVVAGGKTVVTPPALTLYQGSGRAWLGGR